MLSLQKNNDIIKQINQLKQKVIQIRESKNIYTTIITNTFSLYSKHMNKMKSQINNFEQILLKNQTYNHKHKQMRDVMEIFRKFCLLAQKKQKTNFKKDSQLKEAKVNEKNQQFLRQVELYKNEEASYNGQYKKYSEKCEKLNEHINFFKSYENPIKFYNLEMLGEEMKKYDKKYQQCENSQTGLINRLQVLDQKRKLLTQNLKQIEEEFIILMHQHIEYIKNVTTILIKKEKENDGSQEKSISSIHKNVDQQEYNEFLESATSIMETNSNYKLLIDKCESLKNKRYFQLEENIKVQKLFIKFISNIRRLISQLDKQYKIMNRQLFRDKGKNFHSDFRVFFGQNAMSIAQLSLKIAQNPQKRLQKISKCLNIQQQKLKKIVYSKERQIKLSKKRINDVISEYKHNRKQKKDLGNFKNVFQEFMRSIKEVDETFNKQVQQASYFITNQYSHSFMPYLYEKQEQKILTMKSMNIDNEIVEIVKENDEYQFLFNEPLKSQLFQQFMSRIDKQNYEQKKKTLVKKQYQSRQLIKQRDIGCCGVSNSLKLKAITQHKCLIVFERNEKKGILSIFQKGVAFSEKSFTPFSEKLFLLVPNNQVVGYEQKQSGIYNLLTSMGPLSLKTKECQEIDESLTKNIGARYSSERQVRKDTSTSSFQKLSSSNQFKIMYESTKAIQNRIEIPEKQQNLLKEIMQKWKVQALLPKQFKMILQKETQKNAVRQDFNYTNDMTSFLLKEKRSIRMPKISGNFIFFDYEWKVSFPQNSMFKSFRHSQIVKVQLQSKKVKIKIIEKKHEQENLYKRKIFYSEIEKFNKNLSNFIVQRCERQGEVVIEEEKQEESSIYPNVNQENSHQLSINL